MLSPQMLPSMDCSLESQFTIHWQLRNLKPGDTNTILSSEILEICFGQMFYEDVSIPAPFTNHLVLQQQFCCHNLLGNFSAHDCRSLVQNLVVFMNSFIIYFFPLILNCFYDFCDNFRCTFFGMLSHVEDFLTRLSGIFSIKCLITTSIYFLCLSIYKVVISDSMLNSTNMSVKHSIWIS